MTLVWKPKEPKSAAVHVSIICFDDGSEKSKTLQRDPSVGHRRQPNGRFVLVPFSKSSTKRRCGLSRDQKGRAFDISPAVAARMLAGSNPNRKPNRDVITPYVTGDDLNGIPEEGWLIDFGNMGRDRRPKIQPAVSTLPRVRETRPRKKPRAAPTRPMVATR